MEDNYVGIEATRVTNTASTDFPGFHPGRDDSWSLERFKSSFSITINQLGKTNSNFDLVGIDTSIVNAFRRILIAEVPTVAIEEVYIQNNTSIIQDEILAQRLGLIPLDADPSQLRWINKSDPDAEPTDYDTIVLNLNVKCIRNKSYKESSNNKKLTTIDSMGSNSKKYINSIVTSGMIEFEPQGRQSEVFPNGVKPTNKDIVIAKLRPGQEIDLTMHCILGVGNDHAKFSPVATASYRLLPLIDIIGEPIKGSLAIKFQSCFPNGVIGINDKGEAYVKNSRLDTVSREVLRHKEFKGRVKLGRRKDFFIFNIESTGAMTPDVLFVKAIRILRQKCKTLRAFDLRR